MATVSSGALQAGTGQKQNNDYRRRRNQRRIAEVDLYEWTIFHMYMHMNFSGIVRPQFSNVFDQGVHFPPPK